MPADPRETLNDIAMLTTGHECDGEVCLLCLVEGIAKGEINTTTLPPAPVPGDGQPHAPDVQTHPVPGEGEGHRNG